MKKNYKEESLLIGYSDIATLNLVGIKASSDYSINDPIRFVWCGWMGLYVPKFKDVEILIHEFLSFGGDGYYRAYMIDDSVEVPDHYKLVSVFKSWLKIYDDRACTLTIDAPVICVYRAGDYGVLIRVLGEKLEKAINERS